MVTRADRPDQGTAPVLPSTRRAPSPFATLEWIGRTEDVPMRRLALPLSCLVLALAVPGSGLADPWKDESGQGDRWAEGRDRRERRPWFPDRPPGRQPPPHPC
jgi:hypothetical protein